MGEFVFIPIPKDKEPGGIIFDPTGDVLKQIRVTARLRNVAKLLVGSLDNDNIVSLIYMLTYYACENGQKLNPSQCRKLQQFFKRWEVTK